MLFIKVSPGITGINAARPAVNSSPTTRRGNRTSLHPHTGNFSLGSECCTRKTRIIDVVYNASNNELVRTKTLVKNCIVLVDSLPYRQPLRRKRSTRTQKKLDERKKTAKISPLVEDQFQTGELLNDVVLIGSSACDLQYSLDRLAAECEAAGMRISSAKSEAMTLSRKPMDCLLRVGNESLAQVKEFKYLRVLFASEGTMEREIGRSSGGGIAFALPHRCNEKRAEPQGKALDLPVDLRSSPHLWS
ncbi:unnamed protein product [Pleuronectes platessa]|uniref:Uncharacterized protein n=1 Tax=Pleuronectes platessa TaxID=8262 RepID=A0A9N7Z3K3_PLEPL|nr:unnamed protein product [Pleuronectes platessa]